MRFCHRILFRHVVSKEAFKDAPYNKNLAWLDRIVQVVPTRRNQVGWRITAGHCGGTRSALWGWCSDYDGSHLQRNQYPNPVFSLDFKNNKNRYFESLIWRTILGGNQTDESEHDERSRGDHDHRVLYILNSHRQSSSLSMAAVYAVHCPQKRARTEMNQGRYQRDSTHIYPHDFTKTPRTIIPIPVCLTFDINVLVRSGPDDAAVGDGMPTGILIESTYTLHILYI